MVRYLDTEGSCPDRVSSEHQPTEKLTLMDLPMEVIEEIARHADDSLHRFARAHPRFAAIVSGLRRHRIRIDHICESLQRSVALNSRHVGALILMNCHSESSLILCLILRCPHLTGLNTVNSGLATPDLVKSINFLSNLEFLTCTCAEGPDGVEEASLPDNNSIKSVYVEHGRSAFIFLLKLINSCLKIERLHLVGLPYKYLYSNPSQKHREAIHHHRDRLVDPTISRERWQTLQTVILDGLPFRSFKQTFLSVFWNCSASPDVNFADFRPRTRIVYARGTFNVRTSTHPILDDCSLLSEIYSVGPEDPVWHYGMPRQLEIQDSRQWSLSGSLPESIASLTTLVELDLSKCHTENRPHIWDPLFQSSAGLKSLTVPLCLLTLSSWDAHENKVFPFVGALEKLKLKKLCCSGLVCEYSTTCHDSQFLPCLTGLTHLEELTLIKPLIDADFLSRIAIQSLFCLRIIKIRQKDLDFSRLGSFFETCNKLRYLKLDLCYLPLHKELLWRHLSHAHLKQLCIKSFSSEPVDLVMVRRYIPKLCEGLDVLHVHNRCLRNAEGFSSLLTAEIAKINLTREHNTLQAILPRPSRVVIANFPGRALCMLPLKSRLGSVGWDIC